METPPVRRLSEADLGPNKETVLWLFGVRFGVAKCDGHAPLFVPPVMPPEGVLD